MFRTPRRRAPEVDPRSPPPTQDVRRSIGEWETGKPSTSPNNMQRSGPSQFLQGSTPPPDAGNRRASMETQGAPQKPTQVDRVTEARACLNRAKMSLSDARNLRTDIRLEVTRCLERLYNFVKEAEAERKNNRDVKRKLEPCLGKPEESKLVEKLEENNKLLKENNRHIEEIRRELEKQTKNTNNAVDPRAIDSWTKNSPEKPTLHSIIISSKNEDDTGEEILNKVREAVNAKDGWVKVERVRKAKDRKIVMGCRTIEDRNRVKEKIEETEGHLVVEEARNRDPLLIVKDVLLLNSDEDVLSAIKNQNGNLIRGLNDDESRMHIKYKKKARNPLSNHIVLSTSPMFWRRATEAGALHIDLQRVRVADQSPLVQCSRCLGYGHSRRFCKETLDACSHCGGPHHSTDCADRLAGGAPTCRNCTKAKLDNVEHNTFSGACPIRRKWDTIARSTVAYC